MSQFNGFTEDDFNVFLIPEFHDRMMALRTQVRPKLHNLGEDLAPGLSDLVGHPMFAHTASHARRRVNPPDDTWVAFSRSERGYKRYAHFEIGIALDYVFIRFVVKPEGIDDKPGLIHYLQTTKLQAWNPSSDHTIYWYKDDHGIGPLAVDDLTEEDMPKILHHVQLKSRGFTTGIVLPRQIPIVHSAQLITESLNTLDQFKSLYLGTLDTDSVISSH